MTLKIQIYSQDYKQIFIYKQVQTYEQVKL